MKMSFFALVLGFIGFVEMATAQAPDAQIRNNPVEAPSAEERAKVKKRLYPGGRDEDSLAVQAQLPVSSGSSVQDEPPEPSDHD